MLAIYGTSGLMYRGPIEDLRRVLPTLQSARVRALSTPVDRPDFADSGYSLLAERAHARDGAAPPLPRPAAAAVQAYGEVQHPAPQRHPLEHVRDVMAAQTVTVDESMTVADGWRRLAEQDVGQAPVLDAQGRLVGLFTRGQLLSPERLPRPEDSVLVWRSFLAQPLAAIMITPVPAVTPETPLRRLALALLVTGLPGLPVVSEAGGLIGFVSRSDVLKAVVHDPPLDLWAG
ncbi:MULTISPECIES: CBS domain-containing protein [unclassified Tepidimonas]|jgi:CBS domain-containing protein|uniref:CBS domain-containing protein n=1 Tax=unclassified Tepidimonas TaxID=2631705 RepID=UPI002639CCC0|nr:CBS domain-containing protein [uncultured Tepidimonas sp.]